MIYIGFEYAAERHTTTGPLNAHTGKRSIAGNVEVFASKQRLDSWIAKNRLKREAVTKDEAWQLQKGMMRKDFDDMIARLRDEESDRVYEHYRNMFSQGVSMA